MIILSDLHWQDHKGRLTVESPAVLIHPVHLNRQEHTVYITGDDTTNQDADLSALSEDQIIDEVVRLIKTWRNQVAAELVSALSIIYAMADEMRLQGKTS